MRKQNCIRASIRESQARGKGREGCSWRKCNNWFVRFQVANACCSVRDCNNGAGRRLELVNQLGGGVKHIEGGEEFSEVNFVVLSGVPCVRCCKGPYLKSWHAGAAASQVTNLVGVEGGSDEIGDGIAAELGQQSELLNGNKTFLLRVHRDEAAVHARDLLGCVRH
jgi:hypothetical protein